jgi:hypothetical protein
MPRHIGIVACSAEGAALCYRTICIEGTRLLGPHAHPEVSIHTPSLAEYVKRLDREDWQGVGELMLASAHKLAKIGAEGVQAIGVRSKGWGIALKVVDGNARGLHPATVAVLDQLGLLDLAQRTDLASRRAPEIRNYRGLVTGRVEPAVVLAPR